ncbi:MAG: ABC-F family ATP-binding cassette domain-containing protein [Opitutales bacterium]|nr:ABC-F family ATP-binding cassette domain-containing protein [Opitutales bacterium]
MLIVSGLSKAYGGNTLFTNASLRLQRGERIGLIGPNGAGKTTLFRILLGQEEADSGDIQWEKNTLTGFLPQESAPVGEETVLQLATAISPEISAVHQLFRDYPDPEHEKHHEALARYADLDGFSLEPVAKKILAGLAFKEADFLRPARTLSGGWIMRAHLARLLVQKPDLLMLDEPTNHLDLESLTWFQDHLRGYEGSVVVISHDRAFLNQLCNGIVEIAAQRIEKYPGNYDNFVTRKAERLEQQWAAYQNQQKEIERVEQFINRFRAKASKAAQVQSRIKYLDKLERIPPPERPDDTVSFRFPHPPRSGQKVITLENIEQGYDDHTVYRNLNLTLERGQRIALVGPNGAGKSTLLKILADLVPLRRGSRNPGLNLNVGYYAQQRSEQLDLNSSVYDEAAKGLTGITETDIRTLLGCFLFTGDDADKPVRILSGGEKSRLALVKLLLHPPNLLLLDEPTTHLDIASIDALIQALSNYPGTLVMVSHDVHFIQKIATSVIHVNAGQLTHYAGDYEYYLRKSGAQTARGGLIASFEDHRPTEGRKSNGSSSSADQNETPKERRRRAAEERKARAREEKSWEKKIQDLEKQIISLEEEQTRLTSQMEDPSTYNNPDRTREIRQALDQTVTKLKSLNESWEKATEQLMSFQG